jgi:hypothetical protein
LEMLHAVLEVEHTKIELCTGFLNICIALHNEPLF